MLAIALASTCPRVFAQIWGAHQGNSLELIRKLGFGPGFKRLQTGFRIS